MGSPKPKPGTRSSARRPSRKTTLPTTLASVVAAAWLMKTEPEEFSIDDLQTKGLGHWDGVRNYQARNFLRAAKLGDPVLIYHSNSHPPGIAGLGRIAATAYPDPSQFDPASDYYDPASTRADPRWSAVDVAFVAKTARLISRNELAEEPLILATPLFTHSRLSVQPVPVKAFAIMLKLAGLSLP